ncbi:type II toxin-antitoxin system VapC family toxin [Fimbriiglobus ruber]|uniref:Toxin 1, PIN domain n=1 Tax=Fimbriiglobus ruber TaxID=1908690 RepID=A0A225DAA4_9BACT|nr:PIN domain-containing protein [Fimbriiglobus ruber]OWK36594.1 Toxin 1, PIN domain [Fimbriiglobus ruber]
MTTLVDTNILVRLSTPTDPDRSIALAAATILQAGGDDLRTFPQSLYEFWVTATRPTTANGLGLTSTRCAAELSKLEATFPPLTDPADLFTRWKALVIAYQCAGKVAHDARLVAAMNAHGITRILTFNGRDFARYPGITILDPKVVAATPPSSTP